MLLKIIGGVFWIKDDSGVKEGEENKDEDKVEEQPNSGQTRQRRQEQRKQRKDTQYNQKDKKEDWFWIKGDLLVDHLIFVNFVFLRMN